MAIPSGTPAINPVPVSLASRVWQGLKGLFRTSSAHIVPLGQRLTVSKLQRPLTMAELYALNSQLSVESQVSSQFFSREGALLRLTSNRDTIVVGDLHGNAPRLELLLKEYGPRLAAGELNLVFLGDIIHPEGAGRAEEMGSSVAILNSVIRLKQMYPEQIHLLIGNHDEISSLDPNNLIVKRGVLQTLVFADALGDIYRQIGFTDSEAEKMIAGYQSFFDGCALSAIVEGGSGSVFMAHSAVIQGGTTVTNLINARSNGLIDQLLWNSHKKRTSGRQITPQDVLAMINGLGLRGGLNNTYLISGHTPDEKQGWIYAPHSGLNHRVIHGNIEGSFGVVLIRNGMPYSQALTLDQVTTAEV